MFLTATKTITDITKLTKLWILNRFGEFRLRLIKALRTRSGADQ